MRKRLTMMILRNFFRVPYIFFTLLYYAKSDKVSEEKKYKLIRYIGYHGCKCGNVNVHGYGLENLPEQSGYIMFPNHQGLFDVMGLVYLNPTPFSVVIKKEAYSVFGLRQLIQTLGGLFLDRDDVKQGLQVINEVARQVKEGRNFLIFPEGTRSKNGNVPGEFKGGSFKSATKAKCPIVPIAIIDCYLPFDTNSTHMVDVQLHVLPPIPYEEYKGMKTADIADMVKSRIVKVIEENEHNFN
ncbi:MAG: 1-acyl-sn-glycerol-3-phosphate acyltransferase [Bacteroidales bacterium]|nr:1-acyl-sn-glycerol-3-phosphate acyltransferase [Clostridium sp.]MCM1203497.1 1-acyl-sn-glycerol-3-phosphate acyltransferase [Bacteroidales bacterium]